MNLHFQEKENTNKNATDGRLEEPGKNQLQSRRIKVKLIIKDIIPISQRTEQENLRSTE